MSVDILRGAAVAAALTVVAAAAPLAWSVVRQAVSAPRAELIRPLVTGSAAVIGWLVLARVVVSLRHPRPHAGPDVAAAIPLLCLGAAAAAACAWAAVAVVRRADLATRLLRAEVVPMAVLSACMALATGADLGWGLAVRATDGALFHSDNGLIATPLAPNWAASVIVLAAAALVTAAATVRAARELRTPSGVRPRPD